MLLYQCSPSIFVFAWTGVSTARYSLVGIFESDPVVDIGGEVIGVRKVRETVSKTFFEFCVKILEMFGGSQLLYADMNKS